MARVWVPGEMVREPSGEKLKGPIRVKDAATRQWYVLPESAGRLGMLEMGEDYDPPAVPALRGELVGAPAAVGELVRVRFVDGTELQTKVIGHWQVEGAKLPAAKKPAEAEA